MVLEFDFTQRKENNSEEEWKDIKGYDGEYKISSLGNVMSLARIVIRPISGPIPVKEKILKPNKTCFGYPYVSLRNKSHMIHRLVAMHFIPNPENKPTVNHINGVRDDNRLENLEWNTYSENNLHSFKYLGRKNNPQKGKDHVLSKPIVSIDKDGNIRRFEALQVAARELKLSAGNICMVLKGQRNHVNGLKFIYESANN